MEAMDLGIKGKTAVVTGADSGIGLATAMALAAEGVQLLLNDLGGEKLDRAVARVREHTAKGGDVIGLPADITKTEDVRDLSKRVMDDFGGAHILVHSAGIRGASGDFLELTDRQWLETIEVDLLGAVRVCRAFIPQMQELGWGRLVLIASENAFQPYGDESPYNACKAAIVNLSKHLSRAYSREDLLINCVSPAFIRTPMTRAMLEELEGMEHPSQREAEDWFVRTHRPRIAMQRIGRPEEVAAVIAFLCSQRASFVNGGNYRIDGGSIASAF